MSFEFLSLHELGVFTLHSCPNLVREREGSASNSLQRDCGYALFVRTMGLSTVDKTSRQKLCARQKLKPTCQKLKPARQKQKTRASETKTHASETKTRASETKPRASETITYKSETKPCASETKLLFASETEVFAAPSSPYGCW
jgi:hypothetical protein